jgi:tRNA dimethylallyltransferase
MKRGTPTRWIGLAGPTAAGKTAVALAAARAGLAIEVVSVDSALVYRGMDIGTAKPSAAERAELPHHLLDLLDPSEAYSAARFVTDAQAAIADIHARGKLPLLVGGTMLYFKALTDGLDALPAAVPGLRAQLDAEAADRGWPALHAELARVDPTTAARLAPGDAQRIQRALEVFRSTGRPMSSYFSQREAPASPPTLFALEPTARGWLHARIEQRFDSMLADGFLDEVRALRARAELHAGLPSMRAVGYRQAWAALEAGDLSGLRERAVAATRQLAKRQLTWLRGFGQRQVIACDAPSSIDDAVQALRRTIET